MPPDATELTGAGEIDLTRMAIPCPRPGEATPYFDDVIAFWVEGGHPVEPVASEIRQVSPLMEVALQGVEHLLGPVLRVASGDQHLVSAE